MDSLVYRLLKIGAWLFSLIPLSMSRTLARLLGISLYHMLKDRREVTLANLAAAYPKKDEIWHKKTAKGAFEHLCLVVFETIRLLSLAPDKILAQTRQHGLENMEAARSMGKGILSISMHVGNWEWMSVAAGVSMAHQPSTVIVRPQEYPPMDRIVEELRGSTGIKSLSRHYALRTIIKCLRNNETVGSLIDQSTDWYEGVYVDFFGQPTCTVKLIARIALATKAPVVAAYSYRAADGKFDVYYSEPIPLIDTGDITQDVWDNTQNYTRIVEDIIRRHPEQWLWLHKRWKNPDRCPWPRNT